jgi:nucleoside-triphosphatase THEP1
VEPTIGTEGKVHIVTGERGSGKSTVCARVAHGAREHGLTVAGILTEEVAPGGPRRMADLRSGESRPFGSRTAMDAANVRTSEAGAPGAGTPSHSAPWSPKTVRPGSDPLTPGWSYDIGVFDWGNEVLSRSTPCNLLIVDELGPLEILGDRGWFRAFETLDAGGFGAALVVCRPGLLDPFQERIGSAKGEVYVVDLESRDRLPEVILRGLTLTPG